MTHHIELETNHRAHDPGLRQFVKDIMSGNPSEETLKTAKELSRDLDETKGTVPVHLYATNFECDAHNTMELRKMDGQLFTITSLDSGRTTELNPYLVPRKLHLKVSLINQLYSNF